MQLLIFSQGARAGSSVPLYISVLLTQITTPEQRSDFHWPCYRANRSRQCIPSPTVLAGDGDLTFSQECPLPTLTRMWLNLPLGATVAPKTHLANAPCH